MKKQEWIKALLAGGVGYFIVTGVNYVEVKKKAFKKAVELAGTKGILNIGAGTYSQNKSRPLANYIATHSAISCNIDIVKDGLPNSMQLDLEKKLPFHDKQFDVAFMSHILEHIENWKGALSEAQRIADNVIIVLPNPLAVTQYFHPQHKQHFSFKDIENMSKLPGVFIYC